MQFTNLRPLLYVWGLSVNCKQFIKIILNIAFTQLIIVLSSPSLGISALPLNCTVPQSLATNQLYLYIRTVVPDSFFEEN